MAGIFLTQNEADVLIKMEKHRKKDERHSFPDLRRKLEIALISRDKRKAAKDELAA